MTNPKIFHFSNGPSPSHLKTAQYFAPFKVIQHSLGFWIWKGANCSKSSSYMPRMIIYVS